MAKGPKGKEPPVKEAEDEAKLKLPPESIEVITERERKYLPPKPAPARDEKALVGKRVVDTDGLELGYVEGVQGDELKIGEGPFSEWLLLPMNFVGGVGEEIQLIEPLQELLSDVEVFDSKGQSLGWVSDVMATGDVVDGVIVKSPDDSHFVILENIRSLGGTIALDISLEQLKGQQGERRRK